MKDRDDLPLRRILVGLDASAQSLAALAVAVEVAAFLGAEVRGLFVEDTTVEAAAAIPFTAEIRTFAPCPADFSPEDVRRQMRQIAAQARRALERAAVRAEVLHTFEVRRGAVARALLAAAAESDLTVLGQAGPARSSRGRLGAVAWAMVREAPRPLLLIRPGMRLGPPVLALFDGTGPAREALALAARLARRDEDAGFTVLLLGHDAETVHRLRQIVIGRYADVFPRLHVRPLTDTALPRLAEAVYHSRAGLLVAAAESACLAGPRLPRLLATTDCPVLLVP